MHRVGWKRPRAAVALVCAGAIVLNPGVAWAFKAKAHVGVANIALSELDGAFRSAKPARPRAAPPSDRTTR